MGHRIEGLFPELARTFQVIHLGKTHDVQFVVDSSNQGGIVNCDDPHINIPIGQCISTESNQLTDQYVGKNTDEVRVDERILRVMLEEMGVRIVPDSEAITDTTLVALPEHIELNLKKFDEKPGSLYVLILVCIFFLVVGWTTTGAKRQVKTKESNTSNSTGEQTEQKQSPHSASSKKRKRK